MHKIIRLFNTVKYLKPIQVYYRLYYFAHRRIRNIFGFTYPLAVTSKFASLTLEPSIVSYLSINDNIFTFLNLSHSFENGIDWNYAGFGKLWTYNLTYFDFLEQENMTKRQGLELIYDFIDQTDTVKDGLEPFPVSLRAINWVKFLSKHHIKDKKIDDSLYAQYKILMDNLEYHLLGNHLLENGFSLLFGAYCFQDEKLYTKAKEILTVELEEQILNDGAHFELSPMYHQIMLFRVLDCINLVENNKFQDQELLALLKTKTSIMLGWLENITYKNSDIPLLNDSANGIAPTSKELVKYASRLNVEVKKVELKESGYRKIINDRYECVVDVGHIGPDYIPGHAHADTFNFELYMDNKPFIVDTGLSTYETNDRRTEERSTASHNAVEIMLENSSEVWGGFRVADRASVTDMKESEEKIVATHDGYMKKYGILHTREWEFGDDRVIIKDTLNKKAKAIARFHFHPDVTEEEIMQHIVIQHSTFNIQHYKYAPEFNKLIDAKVLEVAFEKELTMEICL